VKRRVCPVFADWYDKNEAMRTLNLQTAKARFSALVKEAASGEEIVISKHGKPKARLTPLENKTDLEKMSDRQSGRFKA
jgi:prevent-host-death family protein